jgi:hypothetical protein
MSSHHDYGFLFRRRLIAMPKINRMIANTFVRWVAVVRTLAREACSESIIIYTQTNNK